MRCPTTPTAPRPAFTLLEVLLAAFITVLLMSALYVALNLQYEHAEAGRRIVEETTLAQNLVKLIADDINQELAPVPPKASSSRGGQAGGGGGNAAPTSPNTTTPTTGGSNPTTTSPASSGNNAANGGTNSSQTNTTPGSAVTFNLGVQGTSSQLTLYVSRVPRELFGSGQSSESAPVSDLRRVSYWMAAGGLARQEIKQATSQDATENMPPDVPNAESLVISGRVRSITFSYWDGSTWSDSWDGTQATGQDGSTPQGPPLAIRVELKIAPADGTSDSQRWKTYRHLISIPTANRLNVQAKTSLTGIQQQNNQTQQQNGQ